MFLNKVKNNIKYRDSVSKWTSVLRLMAVAEKKAQSRLKNIGLMIYLSAGDDEKEHTK